MSRKTNHRVSCEFFNWNLFRRDGVYYADGRMNSPSLGKHSLGTRDQENARAALRELDHRIAVQKKKAQPRLSSTSHGILISEGWERYLNYVARPDVLGGAGASTSKRYRAVRAKHEQFCVKNGILIWDKVGKPEVMSYGAHLKKSDYADATIYLECNSLKQIIKWLIYEEKVLPESNRVRLALRRSHQSNTYCYSREQIQAMIKLCGQSLELKWLAEIIIALATTGMRIGELADLRWTDIDMMTGIITLQDNRHSGRHAKAGAVRTLKGRRSRRIPIHKHLHTILHRLNPRPDGRVFGMPRGGPLLPNSLCKMFIRDVIDALKGRFPTPKEEIGFAAGRIHSFRHAFVSQAFLDGASEGEIREWVGHTNSRIVERYRHLRNEDARLKMDKINFLGMGSEPLNEMVLEGSDGIIKK